MRTAVIAAIVVLASAGAGVAAAAKNPHAALEERIRSADSVRVVRVREPVSGETGAPGEDRLADFIVEGEGRADGEWRTSMAGAITEAMRRFSAGETCPRESGPRRIRFGVEFFAGDPPVTIILYQADRCFEFWTGRTFQGSAGLHDIAPRVLALLKQAFPADTTVRRLGLSGLISCEDYVREHPEAPPVMQPPEATRIVPARYPKQARKAKIEGRVMVQALIGADGTVSDLKVVESVPALDAAALAAVEQWTFDPALDCDGHPVAARLVIPVVFKLD
jgi:TonB family protein